MTTHFFDPLVRSLTLLLDFLPRLFALLAILVIGLVIARILRAVVAWGLGVARVHGLSTQPSAEQREAAERLHLPFALVSDAGLELTRAMNLPTFTVAGMALLKRMAWVVDDGVLTKVFYPVFPPDKSAEEVIAWIQTSR